MDLCRELVSSLDTPDKDLIIAGVLNNPNVDLFAAVQSQLLVPDNRKVLMAGTRTRRRSGLNEVRLIKPTNHHYCVIRKIDRLTPGQRSFERLTHSVQGQWHPTRGSGERGVEEREREAWY